MSPYACHERARSRDGRHRDRGNDRRDRARATLRDALLDRGFSVYGRFSKHANCGGRGLCATCTVAVDPAPEPTHWHDAAAARFGYPRLSCCLTVEEPMRVELLDKYVWGQVLPHRQEREP
ncbi:2Fe-2S iron-sulfur cluster-binding protein [Halococcus dombrowskii]|uniref:2Fe-2S iron-sulfur cluster-binding protein n=1 Tax=Halococcus dombrowskii TaxID=179637 RepID=A0AAX3AMM4_HALDO|nr:2Fe-2S iron-sulfur cluster-binding protein [Halococcus dombrowskii]UOO95006.1 2Fe-2S iron-sulfur cluster-binding protein [Halococcus dombrowskii]